MMFGLKARPCGAGVNSKCAGAGSCACGDAGSDAAVRAEFDGADIRGAE